MGLVSALCSQTVASACVDLGPCFALALERSSHSRLHVGQLCFIPCNKAGGQDQIESHRSLPGEHTLAANVLPPDRK